MKIVKSRLLLVGPCVPPDGGTTIPFRLFVKYIKKKCSDYYCISVLNSATGDKSNTLVLKPAMLLHIFIFLIRLFSSCVTAKQIIIFGSQRFITFIGCFVILVFSPFNKKICLRVNGGGYDQFYKSASPFIKYLMKKIMNRAHVVIVQTQQVENSLSKILLNLNVVSNYRALIEYDENRRIFNTDKISIIYTGIVRKLKGCRELLEAYLILIERLNFEGYSEIDVRLDLYGKHLSSDREYFDYSKYITNRNICFHGDTPNGILKNKYMEADIFAYPTYWPTEGHSGSVIEAMMHGMPLVVSDWRGMNEIVVDGESGLFCPPKDSIVLANKLFDLVTNVELRKKLSSGARKKSEAFDYNVVCKKFINVFELESY